MKIAVFDSKSYTKSIFNKVNEKYNYELKYFKSHLTFDNAILAKGYDVVCVFVNDLVDSEIIDILADNGVKLIALRCAGYNNVDFKAAYKKIHVVRVPAYSPHAIAEHTVALMLTLNRKIHKAYLRTREANFALEGLMGFDFYGKTAGIIGTGKIGKVLIEILKGFGMKILAYDLYPDRDFAEKMEFDYVDELDVLYKESDAISLNCPLTKETEYLINKASISQMKDGVMLINTGRGKLINSKDLIDALKNKKIGSAGLDVYEEESEYFFEDFSDEVLTDDILARLLSFNNVIITSHQGFFTKEALEGIANTTFENIKEFQENKCLTNEICYRCNEDNCKKEERKNCF